MNFFSKVKKSIPTILRYEFVLKNIDTTKIDKNYSTFADIIQTPIKRKKSKNTLYEDNTIIEKNIGTTDIEKIRISSFRKEPITTVISKNKHYYYIPQIDIINNSKLPETTDIPCMGCHRKYTTVPLGIPIRYHPSIYKTTITDSNGKIINEYNQYVTKEERIRLTNNKSTKTRTFELIQNEYFNTDGLVCSFNCMLSVIEEHSSIIYKNSETLMYKLYYMIFGELPKDKIIRSPSWRLLETYGGILSDEEYQKTLQTIEFIDTYHIGSQLMKPAVHTFEVKELM